MILVDKTIGEDAVLFLPGLGRFRCCFCGVSRNWGVGEPPKASAQGNGDHQRCLSITRALIQIPLKRMGQSVWIWVKPTCTERILCIIYIGIRGVLNGSCIPLGLISNATRFAVLVLWALHQWFGPEIPRLATVPVTLGVLTQNSMKKGNKEPSRLCFPYKMGEKKSLSCSPRVELLMPAPCIWLDGLAVSGQSQELLLAPQVPFCNGHVVTCLARRHLSKQSWGTLA